MDKSAITDPNQISPEWLTQRLRANGHLNQGEVVSVEITSQSNARSMIASYAVEYSEGTPETAPRRLILKIPLPHPDNAHEIQFYQELSADIPGAIRCFDAVYSSETESGHLLMEDLAETHDSHPPAQIPPLRMHTDMIVDAFAQLHAQYWNNLPSLGKRWSVAESKNSMATLREKFPAFIDFLDDRLSQHRRQIYANVLEKIEPLVIKRMADGHNLTLVHNDPHIGNFLYPKDPKKDTLRIIDWKSLEVNTGPDVLAHMMGVFWFPERRARMEQAILLRYHNRLLEFGVRDYSWEDCWYDYRLSIIQYVFYPVWHWVSGTHPDIWWHQLERIMLAYDDLKCNDLLV